MIWYEMRLKMSSIRRISFYMHSIYVLKYLLFRHNVRIIQRRQLNLDHLSKRGGRTQMAKSYKFFLLLLFIELLACRKTNKQQFPLKISNENICGIEMLFNKRCYISKFLFISQPANVNLYRINFLIIFRERKMVGGGVDK